MRRHDDLRAAVERHRDRLPPHNAAEEKEKIMGSDYDPAFTAGELAAVKAYELGDDGAAVLQDCLDTINFEPITENEAVVVTTEEQVETAFQCLTEWYEKLDTLHSRVVHEQGAPALSEAASLYLRQESRNWYRKLNEVRREACRAAYGIAGPDPGTDGCGCYVEFSNWPAVLIHQH